AERGVARDPAGGARAFANGGGPAAAPPDRRAAGPMRRGTDGDVVERPVAALVAHALPLPERAADVEGLDAAARALVKRHARRLELLPRRRRVARDAHAQDEAALADAIDGGD